MCDIKCGFLPVFDKNSRVLILGSFPSVKSRQVEFYYGNRQNRFWKILCGFFKEDIPESTSDKIAFLHKIHVALWDVVIECEIEGSSDSSIKNYKVADLREVLSVSTIELILLNGGKAFEIFNKFYGGISVPYIKLPSTSPANTRCDAGEWVRALSSVFGAQGTV